MLNDLEYEILVYVCFALQCQLLLTSLQGMSQLMCPQDMEALILTCIDSMEKIEIACKSDTLLHVRAPQCSNDKFTVSTAAGLSKEVY